MSGPQRVMVVDDSVLARKIVSDVIQRDADFQVVVTASSGKLAVERATGSEIDLIVLDLEMPDMDGIETLDQLRKLFPKLPVVMCSALTDRGARQTLEALAHGANDYVLKPSGVSGMEAAKEELFSQLVPKLRALAGLAPSAEPGKLPQKELPTKEAPPAITVEIVAIGVSTGGPNALGSLIPHLSTQLPVPVLITQHMPPLFTRMLAERLNAAAKLPVVEAEDEMPVEAGRVYLAPGGHHMLVRRRGATTSIELSDTAPENSCKPAVDPMLRSIVDVYGANVLAVILTGMGADGLRGCEKVRRSGGIVIAQDAATSVVWGMPGAVVNAGVAHGVHALSEFPRIIERYCQRGWPTRKSCIEGEVL